MMLNVKFQSLLVLLVVFVFPALILAQEVVEGKKGNTPQQKTAGYEQPDMKFEGAVILLVTFLASGEVGEVEIVSGLSEELNRQAISAARKIKFEPARKDGAPVPVTKKVEYTFFTYYEENDPDLQANAEITKKTVPKFPKDKRFGGISGKIFLTLILHADGKIRIDKVKSDLPKEFEDKAREAALKIRFKPAIAKNGRKVAQIKEIEYEFKPEND